MQHSHYTVSTCYVDEVYLCDDKLLGSCHDDGGHLLLI